MLAGFKAKSGFMDESFHTRRTAMRSLILMLLLTPVMLAFNGVAAAGDAAVSSNLIANPTDLPAYPNLSKASVMHTGKAAAKVYNAETHDSYETVIAWYRKKLVGAKESESGFVKDTLTFSLPKGRQVIVQGRSPITYITLSADAD
jgi:hypothetical protein